jgi:hypothetical protein
MDDSRGMKPTPPFDVLVDETARPGRAVEALAALLVELVELSEAGQELPATPRLHVAEGTKADEPRSR